MPRKIMVSCAVTGSADTPARNRAVPVTPDEIAAALQQLPADVPVEFDPKDLLESVAKMTNFQVVEAVRNGGCWDWKQGGRVYADFGNWAYGFATASKGWPAVVSRAGAGLAQILAGTSKRKWVNFDSFGDDPNDQRWIAAGRDAWSHPDGFGGQDSVTNSQRESPWRLMDSQHDVSHDG